MTKQFSFFDIVIYKTNNPEFRSMDNKEVVIRGMAETANGQWEYGISLLSEMGEGEIVRAKEDELIHTGKMTSQDALYAGEIVKISVDPKTGEGSLVDEEE